MTTVGIPRIQVPDTLAQEKALSVKTFLKPAKFAIYSAAPSDGKSGQHIEALLKGTSIAEYISGETETPPLIGNKVEEIKTSIRSIVDKGLSQWAVINIFAQTVLIGNEYISYLKTFEIEHSFFHIPYGALLIPAAKLFLQLQENMRIINTIITNEEGTNLHLEYFKLLGSFAATLLFAGQIAVYASLVEMAAPLELSFVSLTYFASLLETISKELSRTQPIYKKAYETPTLKIRV